MVPPTFNRIVRHGIDIRRHPFKGVYVCTIGKNQKHSNVPAEVICTLREGRDQDEAASNQAESGTQYGPITLSYRGLQATLRPWDPHTCVIAAGIHNGLIHFPIRPGTRVFALGCSLKTLSHIADTVRESGRLIGVISENHPDKPTQEQLAYFFKRHPRVSVIIEDVHNATLEKYELRLSLPLSSRHAFLMAMHPRLGAHSPARLLTADTQKLAEHIFSFLICVDAAKAKCLVVCDWPTDTKVETIREVVLTHIDILQRWRAPKVEKQGRGVVTFAESTGTGSAKDEEAEEDHDQDQEVDDEDKEGDGPGSSDVVKVEQPEGAVREKNRSKKDESEAVLQWVLLDLPTDRIITETTTRDFNGKLTEVVENVKRLKSGARTGLLAKELLRLTPYFHNDVLLLMKYVAHHDQRARKYVKKKSRQPALADEGGEEVQIENILVQERPPSSSSMPLPSFLGGAGPKGFGLPLPSPNPAQAALPAAPGLMKVEDLPDTGPGPSSGFGPFGSQSHPLAPPGLSPQTQPYGPGSGPGAPFNPSPSGQLPISPPPLPGKGMMVQQMNRKGQQGMPALLGPPGGSQPALQNAAPGSRSAPGAPGLEDSQRWPYREPIGPAPGNTAATDFGPGIWGPPGPPPGGGKGQFHQSPPGRPGSGPGVGQQWQGGGSLQMQQQQYQRGQQKGLGKGGFERQPPKRGAAPGPPGLEQHFPFMGGGGPGGPPPGPPPGAPPGAPPGLPPDQPQYMAMSF